MVVVVEVVDDGGDWVDGGVVVDGVEEDGERDKARVQVPIYSCQSTICLVFACSSSILG